MSRDRSSGRRRAPRAVLRVPDGFSRLSASLAVKSVAMVTVVAGTAVALALPVDASPAALTLAGPAASSSADRTDGAAASRSQARRPVPVTPAVSAPDGAAPSAAEQVGVAGVKAVAKPKPKPKPKPVSTAAAAASSTAVSPVRSRITRSYSTSISARCAKLGLINDAARLCSAVDSIYHLGSIGGYRANAGEHTTGQAIDFMISSKSQGDAVAAWVQGHVSPFNVKYVIWRQRYWEPGSDWRLMEDRGSPTANHMDHVHVTVNN